MTNFAMNNRLFAGLARCSTVLILLTAFLPGSPAVVGQTLSQNTQTNQDNSSMSTSPRVKLNTTAGDIVIELNAADAPKSTENFLTYVRDGFYDNTIFHRVIDGFMIQGGGFEPGMKQKDTRAPIENEANNGLKNDKYTLAMARTNDPHSATAQFFINVANNDFLNHTAPTAQGWGYAVFGKVVEGEDVVDQIRGVKTGNAGFHQNVPTEDVVIEKATIIE
jgi:peptidyl-prolyl cis-trans isomerase B (cyclophilin B)